MTSVAQPSPGVCRAGRDVDGSNLAPGRTRAPRGSFCPPGPPVREGQPWTEEEHRSLRVAWADGGMKRADVAELLRRSVTSVARRAQEMRLGPKASVEGIRPRWRQEEFDELLRLRNETNMTMPEIAARMGRTLAQVTAAAHRRRMARQAKPPAADMTAHVAALIARGINPETARMVLRRAK